MSAAIDPTIGRVAMSLTLPTRCENDPTSTASTLGVRLTDLARHAAGQAIGRPYRDASTGVWFEPTVPHVPGCICPPGVIGCDVDWRVWQHAVATAPAT